MQIIKRNVELRVDESLMRVYVTAPKPTGQYPGILFYSDIYQLGGPITRLADRLAIGDTCMTALRHSNSALKRPFVVWIAKRCPNGSQISKLFKRA